MPIYAYQCKTCGKSFEILQKLADPPPSQGQQCQQSNCSLEKQLSPVTAIFKSANPFFRAGGTPHIEAEQKQTRDQQETAHQCSSGCALHSK